VKWKEQDFLWRATLPGKGHGQPVIWGERLFVTTAIGEGDERLLLCLRKTDAKELWRVSYAQPTPRTKNRYSGFANGSPVVDASRVVACFVSTSNFWVRAFTHEGAMRWERDLGPFDSPHGHGASPVIYESSVIVVKDDDEESFVVALDLADGRERWRAPRKKGGGSAAYSTPIVIGEAAPQLLLTSRSHGVSALDPRTGASLWEAPVLTGRAIASPVVAGALAIGIAGQGQAGPNGLAAVRTDGKGDVAKTHVAYQLRAGVGCVPTPVYFDGRLYLVSDAGIVSALEPATGRVIWSARLGSEFFGSPVVIDRHIYVASSKGEMFVLATGDTFEELARNPLGEATQSTPCVDGGRLYLRTLTHLVCLGRK
jgi:outer membrane protein assembly factor BamB